MYCEIHMLYIIDYLFCLLLFIYKFRQKAVFDRCPSKQEANDKFNETITQFLAVAEAYPELKSDQLYIALMDELAGTENRIAVSRQYYNEAVSKYNKYVRKWSQLIWGFKQLPYFAADEGANTAPVVNFD